MTNLLRYTFISLFIAIAAGYEVSAQVNSFRAAPNSRVTLAKPNGNNNKLGKKIEMARHNFLSQQLNLSESEAVRFWPLYDKYQQELKAVRILRRLNSSGSAPNGTAQIDKELYYDNQIVSIKKRYLDEFLKIMPSEKVSELYKSEHQFNDEVFKQLSERSIRAGN